MKSFSLAIFRKRVDKKSLGHEKKTMLRMQEAIATLLKIRKRVIFTGKLEFTMLPFYNFSMTSLQN